MKLLNCLECHDILSLILEKHRQCRCGKSGGQYVGLKEVEYSGPARILHIRNEDYAKARPAINTTYPWHVDFDSHMIRKIDAADEKVNNTILELIDQMCRMSKGLQKKE